MKNTYVAVKIKYYALAIDGFQEITPDGAVNYYDVDGNPMADFQYCTTVGEVEPPKWAKDIAVKPSVALDAIQTKLDTLTDEQSATLVTQITELVDQNV